MTKNTAHTRQHTGHAHGRRGVKCPRTPQTHHNTASLHTGDQEPSGPGHRTCNTTHGACIPVNRSQVAEDTAQATQHTEDGQR